MCYAGAPHTLGRRRNGAAGTFYIAASRRTRVDYEHCRPSCAVRGAFDALFGPHLIAAFFYDVYSSRRPVIFNGSLA